MNLIGDCLTKLDLRIREKSFLFTTANHWPWPSKIAETMKGPEVKDAPSYSVSEAHQALAAYADSLNKERESYIESPDFNKRQ